MLTNKYIMNYRTPILALAIISVVMVGVSISQLNVTSNTLMTYWMLVVVLVVSVFSYRKEIFQ